MTLKLSNFFTYAFFFVFFNFLAVHYAHMKSPSIDRSFASQKQIVTPMYDASWKL